MRDFSYKLIQVFACIFRRILEIFFADWLYVETRHLMKDLMAPSVRLLDLNLEIRDWTVCHGGIIGLHTVPEEAGPRPPRPAPPFAPGCPGGAAATAAREGLAGQGGPRAGHRHAYNCPLSSLLMVIVAIMAAILDSFP